DGSGASTSNANAEQTDANKRKAKQSKEKQSKAEEKKAKETIFADFASGDADLLSALQGFEAMRNKIKKPMTD
ncbi:Helix-turn-helix domain-containing protein, partial [Dysosmobacter welbionis]